MTSVRRASTGDIDRARQVAAERGWPYVDRGDRSIRQLMNEALRDGVEADSVLVVSSVSIELHTDAGPFRYHPGMGVNRIRQIEKGRPDWMIEAMQLRSGDRVVDATLGLGSDLLVASFVAGPRGQAIGIESEPILAWIVKEGMQSYEHPLQRVTEALRRIEVRHGHNERLLGAMPARSADVVYFDPMFTDPVEESQHMIPIRKLANHAPLSQGALALAKRVAARRVVVKDRRDGPYATSGWFDAVMGSPRSKIAYCVLEVSPDGREAQRR